MPLNKIFKDKPELLETPEVQELIKFVQDQHLRSYNIHKRKQQFYDNVFEACMYSEVILIKGLDSRKTVENILQLINEF